MDDWKTDEMNVNEQRLYVGKNAGSQTIKLNNGIKNLMQERYGRKVQHTYIVFLFYIHNVVSPLKKYS